MASGQEDYHMLRIEFYLLTTILTHMADIDLQEFVDTRGSVPSTIHARNKAQIEDNRRRVSELKVVGYTSEEIADIINNEMLANYDADATIFPISANIVRQDWMKVRKEWQSDRVDSFEMYVNEELVRLEMQTREAWRQYRAVTAQLDSVLESVSRTEYEENIDETDSGAATRGSKTTRSVNREELAKQQRFWFDRIESLSLKRHRVLGLSGNAPSVLIDNRRQEVNVNQDMKKYTTFSPDDWDEKEVAVDQQENHVEEGIYE